MGNFKGVVWPEWKVNRLKTLWDDGISTSEIGKELGVTRNAVIGKARREGLQEHPSCTRPKATPAKRKPPTANFILRSMNSAKQTKKKKPPQPIVIEPAPVGGISILKAGPNHCKAVIGRGDDKLALYCGGNVVAGYPWCEDHKKRFIVVR